MLIKVKRKFRHPDEPQRHESHRRPITRRELIAQGFMTGGATLLTTGLFSLFANPREAFAQLASDLQLDASQLGCGVDRSGTKVPFICFDLAGGGNLAGSNVLVGQQQGQLDVLSTAGYSKLGLPGNQIPGVAETAASATGTSNGMHVDTSLGLAFHSDSAFLRGMYGSFKANAAAIAAGVNGAVIPARSENDTSNNPHNPLYGIQRAGAEGSILTLIGSQNTDSGGNSMSPAMLIDPQFRPTKVDRPSDVTGLVGTSDRPKRLSHEDEVVVMEAIYRLSKQKMGKVSTGLSLPDSMQPSLTRDEVVKELVRCGYLDTAYVTQKFGNVVLDPSKDTDIVGPNGIFTVDEFNNGTDGNEFRKTASVMKMVIDGYAGAGCITMGGYDYHGGARQEGETKDFRAGRCMGACLAYAMIREKPLMMYVFSDGSLSSNGAIDNSAAGRGKGEWTSDNQDTAAPFFLVYNPPTKGGRPQLITSANTTAAQHQQLGYFSADGNVVRTGTPGANNVNLLVYMVLLNYMALNNNMGQFAATFPNHGLGSALDRYVAFAPII
jgi:hypothetical protein